MGAGDSFCPLCYWLAWRQWGPGVREPFLLISMVFAGMGFLGLLVWKFLHAREWEFQISSFLVNWLFVTHLMLLVLKTARVN